MGKKFLTDVEKARILALREENVTINEICRRTGRAKSTIFALLASARQLPPNTIPQYRKRHGPKKKTTPETDRLLKETVMKNPWVTAKQLKNMYPDQLQDISERTVQHRLRKHLKLPNRAEALKPLLNVLVQKVRLHQGKQHKNGSLEQGSKVMRSDESSFQDRRSNRKKTASPQEEPPLPMTVPRLQEEPGTSKSDFQNAVPQRDQILPRKHKTKLWREDVPHSPNASAVEALEILISSKLKNMSKEQRLLAEKVITQLISKGLLGQLSFSSQIAAQS